MQKDVSRWYASRLEQDVQLVRWGHYGTPVLLFPTAGGDAEEVERFHLIGALAPLIDAGRIKVYSTDSVAGRAWISGDHSAEYCSLLQNRFDEFIYEEVKNDVQLASIAESGSPCRPTRTGRVSGDLFSRGTRRLDCAGGCARHGALQRAEPGRALRAPGLL